MMAEFVRVDGKHVVVRKNGEEVRVELKQLVAEDRQKAIFLQITGKTSTPPAAPVDGPRPVESRPVNRPRAKPAKPTSEEKGNDNRVWTDRNQDTIKARFVRVVDSKVILKRGSRFQKIEFGMLSRADQDYLRQLLAKDGKEHLLPKPGAEGATSSNLLATPDSPELGPTIGTEDTGGFLAAGVNALDADSLGANVPDVKADVGEINDVGMGEMDVGNAASMASVGDIGGDLLEGGLHISGPTSQFAGVGQGPSQDAASDPESPSPSSNANSASDSKAPTQEQQQSGFYLIMACIGGAAILFIYWIFTKR